MTRRLLQLAAGLVAATVLLVLGVEWALRADLCLCDWEA